MSPTQLQPAFENYKTGQRVSWSPDGTMISTSADDGSVRIFDLTAGASQLCNFTALNHVLYTSWSYDGTMLASADKTVGLYNMRNIRDYKPVSRYPDGSVDCVTWSLDGSMIATGSSDHTVGVWDAVTGGLKWKLYHQGSFGKDENILAVRFNHDGSRLASAGSNSDRCVFSKKEKEKTDYHEKYLVFNLKLGLCASGTWKTAPYLLITASTMITGLIPAWLPFNGVEMEPKYSPVPWIMAS